MIDYCSFWLTRQGLLLLLLVGISPAAGVRPALSQQTGTDITPGGQQSPQGTEEQQEEIEEAVQPPPPPPPDGLLPVGELARFEYAPRDRPRVLFVGNYLIITTRGGIVQGIDATTGEAVWKLGLAGEELLPPVALPPSEKLFILVSTPKGHLFLLDGRTGHIESEKELPFALALEPLVSQASILYAGTPEGIIHAFDLETDAELFATPTEEPPSRLAASSDLLVVSGGRQTLTALDPSTGAVKWTHIGRGPFHARAVFAADGKRLYVGNDTGEFYCLEAKSGKVEFRWSTGAAIRAPVLVEDKRVYVASYGDTVYAYAAGSGDEQWRANLPGRPASGPIRVYKRFIVATQDGTLMEIEPARGHLGKSYVAAGEIFGTPAFRIVPAPPIPSTAEESEPATEEESAEEDESSKEPKFYELSRIAIALRSGQVLLLRHQPPKPVEETPSSPDESPEVPNDQGVRPPTSAAPSVVPF